MRGVPRKPEAEGELRKAQRLAWTSIAYICSTIVLLFALLMVGVYLIFDGGMKLAMKEHPTIGGFPLLGHVVWTGWLGIAVLLWSSIPAYFLGRAKRKAADVLHDKTLPADADIMDRRPLTLDQKADDPVPDHLTEFIRGQPWVEDAIVRVRERGREFTAEAHVVPRGDQVDVAEISRIGELACKLDPRLADVTIAPVKALPEDVAKARQPEKA